MPEFLTPISFISNKIGDLCPLTKKLQAMQKYKISFKPQKDCISNSKIFIGFVLFCCSISVNRVTMEIHFKGLKWTFSDRIQWNLFSFTKFCKRLQSVRPIEE
jgi:hypothetical protein